MPPLPILAAVTTLIDEGLLHPHLRERIPESLSRLYGHQERALRAIAEGRTTLVSTGTGSGKTECFLYPIVSRCLALRDDDAPSGISAVIVYPMNALAEDQLMRLRGLLAGTGIPFGMYVGKTPEHESGVAGVRLSAGSSRADYEARLQRARDEGSGETVYPAEEVCSREVMRTAGRQPRILLTNVKQLELLLTRQQDIELFAGARLDFLVFDEAHTFSGALGAETACLVRRLRAFCGTDPTRSTCIATSATMRIGAAQVLDMHLDDLQILVVGHVDRDEVDALLWDPMPGGSGLLDQLRGRFGEVAQVAREIRTPSPTNPSGSGWKSRPRGRCGQACSSPRSSAARWSPASPTARTASSRAPSPARARDGRARAVARHDRPRHRPTVHREALPRRENDERGRVRHVRVTLEPTNPDFEPIELTVDDEDSVTVVADLVEVIGLQEPTD